MKKKPHQLSKGSGISPLPCTRIYQESLLSQQHQKSALCLQTTERFKSSVSTDSKNFPIWRHINIKIFKIHYVEMKDCINADMQLINKTNSPLPRHTVRNISSLQLYNNILGFFFFFNMLFWTYSDISIYSSKVHLKDVNGWGNCLNYHLPKLSVLLSKMQYWVLQGEIRPKILNGNWAHGNKPASYGFHVSSWILQIAFHLLAVASEIRIYGIQTPPWELLANDDDGLHPILEMKNAITITNFNKEKETGKFAAIVTYFIKNRHIMGHFTDIVPSLPSKVVVAYKYQNKHTCVQINNSFSLR